MQNQVEQIISQLTGNAMMFTAFDITMMLRRANPNTNIRHGEVRDSVHNLYCNNQITGYMRDLQRMDNGQDAQVYHPYGSDVEDYDPNFFAHTTPQSVSVPNLSMTTATVTDTQAVVNNPTTQTTTIPSLLGNSLANKPKRARYAIDSVPKDKFGRIRVPASVLRAAGFRPSDSVRVALDSNLIVVTGINDAYGAITGKKYVVDQYNNIRVHLKGKYQSTVYKMQPSVSPARVYITPA